MGLYPMYKKGDTVSFMLGPQVVHAKFCEYCDNGLRALVWVRDEQRSSLLRVLTEELV